MTTQINNPTTVTCEKTDVSVAVIDAGPDRPDLGILQELGSIGAGHAATSLSEVLQQQVLIDIPKIHTIAPHLLPQYYHRHEVPTTAVYMQLANSQCDILLMFEVSEAKKIAAMMTMAPSVEELDPAMEASAMQELANILIGSFLTAISDFTGVQLMPTTPERAVDTFDSIIDNFLVKQSMSSEEALIFDTHFKRAGEDANSILMIFPSPELQSQLIEKSKEQMGL
jgi:chemotaxis protein CheC